jgi:predicted TIM-barrel fold metal-dependent hydrolase
MTPTSHKPQAAAGVPIIDALVAPRFGEGEMSIPREALRDRESLAVWPSRDLVGHVFGYDKAREERHQLSTEFSKLTDHARAYGIQRYQVLLPHSVTDELLDQLFEYQDVMFASMRVSPHQGMDAVREIDRICSRYPFVRSVSLSPHMYWPPLGFSAKEYYPIYAKCVELDRAVYVNVGFPGPRVPAKYQDPLELDEVCWFFPDLRVVMRHGGEPWADVCVQMMLRWPNMYYATTAYAPRHYPAPILRYCNTRGRDKIIWAGFFPMMSYDRVLGELWDLDIKPEVWPKLLHDNAVKAFGLASEPGTPPA